MTRAFDKNFNGIAHDLLQYYQDFGMYATWKHYGEPRSMGLEKFGRIMREELDEQGIAQDAPKFRSYGANDPKDYFKQMFRDWILETHGIIKAQRETIESQGRELEYYKRRYGDISPDLVEMGRSFEEAMRGARKT